MFFITFNSTQESARSLIFFRSRDGVNKTKSAGTLDDENAIPDPMYLRRYEHFPEYYRWQPGGGNVLCAHPYQKRVRLLRLIKNRIVVLQVYTKPEPSQLNGHTQDVLNMSPYYIVFVRQMSPVSCFRTDRLTLVMVNSRNFTVFHSYYMCPHLRTKQLFKPRDNGSHNFNN